MFKQFQVFPMKKTVGVKKIKKNIIFKVIGGNMSHCYNRHHRLRVNCCGGLVNLQQDDNWKLFAMDQ